ncbi:methyl-accepting chemotaxis protein [Paenibacillus sp. D2_2]|uniref:methyl-accepting chemotaxis protein n=1 Tax=Paenibacillus sp. D2_2 TaxID=3073092 RepID=UPI002815AB3F|nr:methyl-accepting chemotaxis protein [Paenibacillus sp. D2_2]WMT41448.1 methyl-accepting chemotaxis protein [Paenibacillus sp. D2_2]
MWERLQIKTIGMKIFIILFVTVVLLSAVLGFSSYTRSKEIIRAQVGLASSQAIEQAADKLDFLLTEYESLSRQLAVDQVLRLDLESVVRDDIDIVKKTEAETRIRNKLGAMQGSDNRLVGIRLVNDDLSGVYATSGATSIQKDEAVQARLQRIIAADGKPVWISGLQKGFFGTSSAPSVTMGRVLQNLKHPEAEYILLIEVKDMAITNLLSNLRIGQHGEVRVLTADNTIVHAPEQQLIESKSDISIGESEKDRDQSSFIVNSEQDGKQLVVYRQLQTVDWRMVGFAPEKDFVSAADQLLYMAVYILLAAIVIALCIGYYLYRMVGRPLKKLSRVMEEGEQGNLQVRVHFKSKDEIGRLGQSFNRMLEQISSLVERSHLITAQLLTTADNLSSASQSTSHHAGEIAGATKEIVLGSANLASEADRGSHIADEIGAQVGQVIQLNTAMNGSATRVITVSQQGKTFMDNLVGKTEDVSRMTGLIEENSEKLSKSTHSIRNILAPMIEMTKQTNILSLNASIEASRAGAAGKGFVVIADEIRKLASESNNSIQTVSSITEEIQEAIQSTVAILQSVTPLFQEQLHSVQEASSIFQNVTNEMEGFVSDIDNSSASVHELNGSQEILREFLDSVSAVVQQSNASTEEVASMSSEQHKVSEELVQLADKLKELSESLGQSLSVFHINTDRLRPD